MPYFTAGNAKVYGVPVTLAAAAERTASGSGIAWVMGTHDTLRIDLAVTAASGSSPTLDVVIEHSPDGNTWTQLAAFTRATAAGTQHKVIPGCDNYVRASWTIGGTNPSFDFGVSGSAA